ncbi:MAG TPA: IS630 family transposase [Acetobacteraceae bacterium]|nr:IS630 family transposase [Acetobacteraceae bacterium]
MTAKQAAVKKYVVKLSNEEREQLNTLIRTGKHRARQLVKTRILLKAEAGEGWSDSQIASAPDTTVATVARTRQRLVEEGFEAALTHKHSPASARPRIFDGETEAKLIALACSKPPKGRTRWTLKLLETAVVELNIVDRASDNTIGRTLKKLAQAAPAKAMGHPAGCQRRFRSRHGRCAGGLPETARSRVSRVCLDETSKQLIAETRVPIPAKPGHSARHDYEYERNGTANLFMIFAPLEGWRHVKVTERHTATDYAQVLKDISDTHFPKARKIILVQDNLNTHKPASLYDAFPAAEARRLVEWFEWHYTPKHGSWLDMAGSELSVLSSQCLNRRISDKQTLIEEVTAWQNSRNKNHAKADWQFTTADARVKLKRLYPTI